MDDFEKAHKLFKDYERSGAVKSLEEAIEILDVIAESQHPDSQKARNLKKIIGKYLDTQIKDISTKCNFKEFCKNLKTFDDIITFLSGSLTEQDAIKFFQVVTVKIDHFEE
jgi:hypothetical protein